jgi:hypothetical protein
VIQNQVVPVMEQLEAVEVTPAGALAQEVVQVTALGPVLAFVCSGFCTISETPRSA